jgi:hypothetical protein
MRTICCSLLAVVFSLLAVRQIRADGADWQDPEYQRYRRAQDAILDGGIVSGGNTGYRVTYTAVTYSPSLGRQGWARNYSTPQAARLAALRSCGGRDARVIICAPSHRYVALAVGDSGAAGATGRTAAEARRIALQECEQHTTHSQICLVIYAP